MAAKSETAERRVEEKPIYHHNAHEMAPNQGAQRPRRRVDSVRAEAEHSHRQCHHHHQQEHAAVPPHNVRRQMRTQPLLNIGQRLGENGRWTVLREIADGGFGQVYEAVDHCANGRSVAIKVEAPMPRLPLLQHEYEMFGRLKLHFGPHGMPKHLVETHGFGNTNGSVYLVMDLCGENLRELKKGTPEDRFSGQTSLMIAIQMVEAVKQLHDAGWIHRDVKPSNFCFGKPTHLRTICIIDFGLARKYTSSDGRHRPARSYSGFHGTPRYASLMTHDHQDMGRRDDMWSIFYITVENIRGQVPWRNMVDKAEVRKRKASTDYGALLSGFGRSGDAVMRLGDYLSKLRFETEPDYPGIVAMFRSDLEEMGVDPEKALYDWEMASVSTDSPMSSAY